MAHTCLPLLALRQAQCDRVVCICDGHCTTAADAHDRVALLSRALPHRLNVRPGDRVALLGLNSDCFFLSLLAVLDAGAVACPLNWRWSQQELAAALALVQPTVLMADEECMQAGCAALGSIGGEGERRECAVVRMARSGADGAGHQQQPQRHVNPHAPWQGSSSRSSRDGGSGAAALRVTTTAALAAAAAHQQRAPHHAGAAPPCSPSLQLLHPPGGSAAPALLVFTSGTTGASKAAALSHASLAHQSAAKLAVVGYASGDVYLHMAPLFHIGGLSSAFAVLMAGGAHVFLPRYSPGAALKLVRRHRVSALIAVPAMMQDIVQAAAGEAPAAAAAGGGGGASTHPAQQQQLQPQQLQPQQLPHLRRVLVGAGGMGLDLQRAVRALFPHADLQTAYGMTEAGSSITFISLAEQQRLMAQAVAAAAAEAAGPAAAGVCVGRPGPGIAVAIAAAPRQGQDQGQDPSPSKQQQQQQQQAPPGVVGEVLTRGPHVMCGYWRAPAATQQALSADGWLHTGDLGYLDALGNLWLVGRLKDMVKSGGENVHAAEVEAALLRHPGVAAAAVFGLEHDRLGEQVAAVVVLAQPCTAEGLLQLPAQAQQQQAQQQQAPEAQLGALSLGALQRHCRAAGLSPYKVPRVVAVACQLPLNSSGKVMKQALKQQLQQALGSSGSANAAAGSAPLRSKL